MRNTYAIAYRVYLVGIQGLSTEGAEEPGSCGQVHPIDTFGQLFVTNGGRWYQRRSLPALDALFAQQTFIADPEARKKLIWEMDTLAMNDAAYLILQWPEFYHVRWNFVKGWTHTPNLWSTNARLDTVWMDLPEFPHTR